MTLLNAARVGLFSLSCVVGSAFANAVTYFPNSTGVTSAAGNTSSGAPGFGNSSFSENGNTKGELYVTPVQLFGHAVSFADIASISYWTNKPVNGNPNVSPGVDWSLYLYTAPTRSNDTGSFYHSRLVAEPLYSNPTFTPNAWNRWTTDGTSGNALTFYDSARDAGFQGTFVDPTFATLKVGPYQWTHSGTTNDYRTESILYFSLQTGSAWANGFLGLVDGLTVTLVNGEIGTLNLAAIAAVPEPESVALFALGLGALFAASRRKRAAR